MIRAARSAPRVWSSLAGLAVALALQAAPAHANPQDVEEGEPVTVEDAFTDPPGLLSLQYSGSYTRDEAAPHDLLEMGPTLKLGLFNGVQVSLNPNYDLGRNAETNSGFVLSDVLVQLNRQTAFLPAFAIDVFYSAPFGPAQSSSDTIIRAIASKFLGDGEDAPRLHLNLTDYNTARPDIDARRNQIELVFGGSVMAGRNGAIVADVVAGSAETKKQSEMFVEIGYSRDLPGDWNCQIGIGQQVNGSPSALRIFFAVEKELQIF